MSVNGMSVGRDYSFGFYDGTTGVIVDLGDVQSVKISQMKHDISNRPYNKPPSYGYIPDGYKITFQITRTGAQLEDFVLNQEAIFNAGGHIRAGYLNETISNPDGSVTRYQYRGFVFFLTDQGDISREKTITLSGEGMASERVAIA